MKCKNFCQEYSIKTEKLKINKLEVIRLVRNIAILTGVVTLVGNGCGGFTTSNSLTENSLSSHGGVSTDPKDYPFSPVEQPELKPINPREYDKSVNMMLGLNQNLGTTNLPASTSSTAILFDNNTDEITFSKVYIESFEFIAEKIANAFVVSSTRNSYIPCVAKSPSDRECLEKFAIRMGTIAYRKPLAAADVKTIVDFATQQSVAQLNFNFGLKAIIQYTLQDPQFLYRFESGTTKGDNLFELTPLEYLTKMTFFVLGSPPTSTQIQQVASGALATDESRETFIENLVNSPAAADQMDVFHSMWLGYSALGSQDSSAANFRTETKALITRTLQEDRPWSNLLTSSETYANGTLAKLYNLDDQTTTTWKWRRYVDSNLRQGLLSHGSFLSVGVKFGDTSTTRRGYNIQKALFCTNIGRPPSVDENGEPVDIDEPPSSDIEFECKEDLYRNTVLARQNCAGCHAPMDNVGFGLENFSADGTFRSAEPGKPQCQIRGLGNVSFFDPRKGMTVNLGTFSGPKGLADLALNSGYLERCLASRVIEFSTGRRPTYSDSVLVNKVNAIQKTSVGLKSFLKNYLMSEEFRFRKGS